MRICSIHTRSLICFFSVLFLVLTVNIPASHAQDLPDGAIARLGKGRIDEIAYSPSGGLFAVGAGNSIWVHDTVNYQETSQLVGFDHVRVSSIAFSPDGQTAASASGTDIYLWDVHPQTTTPRATLRGHNDRVHSIAFSPDGRMLASGSGDRTVRLWNVADATLQNTLTGHTNRITSVAFSPNGQTLASASGDATVRLWDVGSGALRNTLTGHKNQVVNVAFSPDGQTLASASWDNTGRLWDVGSGTLRNTLQPNDWVQSVAFSIDGGTLASGSHGKVHLWDVATATLQNTLTGHTRGVYSVDFSPDGLTLASASEDEVHIWDIGSGTRLNTLTGYTSEANSVAFSPDGQTLAVGNWGGPVRLWNVANATLQNTLQHSDQIYSVAFSPDGFLLASGSWYEVHLWDVESGTRIIAVEHPRGVRSVAFSPDGLTLASGGEDNTIRLWDVGSPTPRTTLTEHTARVFSVAFSPDGQTLASASEDATVRLWNVANATVENTIQHPGTVNSVAFSPDGQTLASASGDEIVRLWNVTDATLQNTFEHRAWVRSVAFSPDGQTLAAGSWYEVRVWDIPDGTRINTFKHTDWIRSVAFSPDGTILASGTEDGTAILWQLTPTTTPPSPAIAFNPPTVADQTFALDIPISPLQLPVATGGTPPYFYDLSPIPDGLTFNAATQVLSGTPITPGTTHATYTAIDVTSASAALNFTILVVSEEPPVEPPIEVDPLDVNGDGEVTVIDLAIVALFYGTDVPVGVDLPADVNADGVVDLLDLTAVAHGIDAAGGNAGELSLEEIEAALVAAAEQAAELEAVAAAPMGFNTRPDVLSSGTAYLNVTHAFADARHLAVSDVLAAFLTLLAEMGAIPETTALLPNYPNPFNPETWIPYHLAKAAAVKVTIYTVDGEAVRELVLGHQPAGVYESRGRAAYWDGRNQLGEHVASGVYFYTLTAGDFTATRKMLIAK